MTLPFRAGTPSGPRPDETKHGSENQDPFSTTSPHKNNHQTQTTVPTTPTGKANTPLHKRFLKEVTMSPSTPPRTPSHSPKRVGKERLEVGQNGFYFSMEIPERKIVPSRPGSRAATPNEKPSGRLTPSLEQRGGKWTPGRLSPSPQKDMKSEAKGTPNGGGSVRDILRKNLFGTPTKNTTKPGREDKHDGDVKMSASKDAGYLPQMSSGSGSESHVKDAAAERATSFAHHPAQALCALAPSALQNKDMSPENQTSPTFPLPPASVGETAAPVLRKAPTASTPSNIGHLMANHSSKSAKVQKLPTTGGLESMPTPLRKMSERLGLDSPHVVRKKHNEHESKDFFAAPALGTMTPPISMFANNVAEVKNRSSTSAPADEASVKETPGRDYETRNDNRHIQSRPSPIAVPSSTASPCPSTATTPSYLSPSTPSRPGLSSRTKSFGTPARLRSSMQEDMFKVQESLKRSLGQEAFQKTASRPTTPKSPSIANSTFSGHTTDRSTSTVKMTTRPLSMSGSLEPNVTGTAQAVTCRLLGTAARKPRPKSMVVGSAKVLETIASQIDSPRERAKLRSTGAAPVTQQSKAMVPRAVTASWTSRGSSQAATKRKPVGSQPLVRTTPAPRAAVQPKRAALPSPLAVAGLPKQRIVSAEVIADRVAAWNKESKQQAASKPAAKLPVRSKSVKAPSKFAAKPTVMHAVKPPVQARSARVCTPEPKDLKSDSGTAQSFTPPGLPTQLPMSPSKKLLVAPTTPSPLRTASKDARRQKLQNAHRNAPPPSAAAQLRTPGAARQLARTPAYKRHTWVGGLGDDGSSQCRTPSKEVQNRLDEAIDRKIMEDRTRAGWI